MFQGGNMTSYEAYPPINYINEYNKTGMLHLKYKTMNQIEVPQMIFAKRQDKLDTNIINKIDLDNVIRTNNITPLENISGELIYQEIKDEDYDDQNLPKLLKTFQYALEYLFAKQTKLDQTNKKLNTEYEQLIQQSIEIENKLKINKNEITKKKAMKKEHEFLLLTYESLVNFNCNPTENTNIIMKNIKSNYGENITEYERNRNKTMRMGDYQKNARFYCHICNGKYFNTEIGLENHMKRRHLAQIRQNSQREKEEMKVEEIQDLYDKKLEETKNHFQNLLMQKNEMISKANLADEINLMKRENDEKFKLILDNNKNFTEEMGNMFKDFKLQQDEYNQNILNMAKEEKKKIEKQESPKVDLDNKNEQKFNELINSIENLGQTIKNKEVKNNINNTQMKILNEINYKLDILNKSPSSNTNKYNYNFNTNINTDMNINPDKDIKNKNVENNIIMTKKNEINYPPNASLDLQNKNNINKEEKKDSFAKEFNLIPSGNDNQINYKEENNNNLPNNLEEQKVNNQNNEKNNIFSQGDFKSNNFKNYKESKLEDIEKNNKNDEMEFDISKLPNNNNILESNFDATQNNIKIEPNLKYQQNQNNQNDKDLGTIQESNQNNLNENNKENNDHFSKTDPKAFNNKELNDKNNDNFQPQKTFNKNFTNDKLLKFAKDFKKRDDAIIHKTDPDINDLNDFAKEIVEDEKFANNIANSKNVENFIEQNAQEKNFENIKDLDKKSEGELLDIIKNTLNNINKINEKSQIAGLYFETMNKLLDFKMIENEEKMMREAYNQRGELKKTRSTTSKAKNVIQKLNDSMMEHEDI